MEPTRKFSEASSIQQMNGNAIFKIKIFILLRRKEVPIRQPISRCIRPQRSTVCLEMEQPQSEIRIGIDNYSLAHSDDRC